MFADWVSALSGLFSALFVPTAIVFASRQWKEMTRQTERTNLAISASCYQSIADQLQEIDLIFVRSPQLRPYFYNNVAMPTGPERDRVLALAELLVDFIDNVVTQSHAMPASHRDVWFAYFREQYACSPAIREYWATCSRWYRVDMHEVFKPVSAETFSARTQVTRPRAWLRVKPSAVRNWPLPRLDRENSTDVR